MPTGLITFKCYRSTPSPMAKVNGKQKGIYKQHISALSDQVLQRIIKNVSCLFVLRPIDSEVI